MTNRKPVPGCLLCEESICDECGPRAALDTAVPGSDQTVIATVHGERIVSFVKAMQGGITQWQADLLHAMTSWGEKAAELPGPQPQGNGWAVYDPMMPHFMAGQAPSGDEEGWVDMGEEDGPTKAVAIETKTILPAEVHIEDKSIDVERAWRATRDLCRG